MYLLGLNLVTMETFVVQRSQSAPPSMVYTPHLRTHLINRKWKPTEGDVERCYNSDERTDEQLA